MTRTCLIVLAALGALAPGRRHEPPATAAESEVRAMEKQWNDARVRADVDTLNRILSADWTITHGDGTINTKAEYLADLKSGAWKFSGDVKEDELTVRVYDDTAVAAGVSDSRGTYKGRPFAGLLRFSRVYVKRDGRWLMVTSHATRRPRSDQVRAVRLPQNPLITVHSSPSLGDNVNGATIVRVPAWVKQPLGRYYAYFAHHKGRFIRLAYADAIAGPWKVHEPGVLRVDETAFMRPQPDPPNDPEFYTHVASPEVFIDDAQRRLVMWVHGWWTNNQPWPPVIANARGWARQNGYAQYTQSAVSRDGLRFDVQPAITKTSYLRTFQLDGYFYAIARLGQLLRSKDPLGSFEIGPNPFKDTPYAGRVRHVALLLRGRKLFVFFSGIGDAPERIVVSTIDLSGDWQAWKASAPAELLRPRAPYECSNLPVAASAAGEIEGPAQQLRDPAVFEDGGRVFLFYSICGEQGIAAAELTVP